jgi:ATP-dependent RNA helicase DDX24/MAK5
MVEKGHFEELQNLLEMINSDEEKKNGRQTFVFSATLTLIHELPKHMRDKKKSKNMTTEEKLLQVTVF